MKTNLFLPVILIAGFISCNSGGNGNKTSSDSTMTMNMSDSAHASMNMNTESSLPAIPAGATVAFKNLKDGETVSSPVKIEMEATGIAVDTAGAVKPNSGHFHILVDAEDSIPSGEVVATDSSHIHFGKAQTETSLNLSPGKHKLVLQFADGAHRSYGSKLASEVKIKVK